MCVIIHKPAGIGQPSVDTLESCAKRNSDGGGFMLSTPSGKQFLSKGWFKNDNLLSRLDEIVEEHSLNPKACEIVYHYRISTAGKVDMLNTHPYILEPHRIDDLEVIDNNFDALAHNGSFLKLTEQLVGDELLKNYSDTYVLSKYILAESSLEDKRDFLEILADSGNKFAIMYDSGRVERFGKFYEREGIHFSNLRHTYSGITHNQGWSWTGWKQLPRGGYTKCEHEGEEYVWHGGVYCDDCDAFLRWQEASHATCKHESVSSYGYCEDCREYLPMDYYESSSCPHNEWELYGNADLFVACSDCGSYLGYMPDLLAHNPACKREDLSIEYCEGISGHAWYCNNCETVLAIDGETIPTSAHDAQGV